MAFSLPPWGWWPLAWIGLGLLALTLEGLGPRRRLLAGAAFGAGQFVVGLWWMKEFNAIGSVLVMALETSAMVGAAWAVSSRRSLLATPAALVLAESVRGHVPFGGLPMAGVALGQVGGPMGQAARVGGALLVLGLAAAAGCGLGAAVRRRWLSAAILLGIAVAGTVAGFVAPDGGDSARVVRMAVVQGGGRRGFRAVDSDPQGVFDAHVQASLSIRRPVDLVLWPEDVIDTDLPIAEAAEAKTLTALALRTGAPIVAGVVEDAGPKRFRNAAVVWSSDGQIVDRYDKVHRVPFGEYVPGRSLIEKVADLSVIPRDAVPGRGPGVVLGRLGVVISYEVYFADRARAAANAGGRVLLVPTNAASFKTSQVPTTEVAAARLRAIETGRDVAQAAPTGYGALIDHRGRVDARTTLGRRQVVRGVLHERTGRTLYSRTGDWPVLLLAALGLLSAWRSRPRRRRSPSP
ncbi:MAG: apolipoprotein N-acyltransferase [Acidimicrobiaceae bacterium]|nr:apolipoprotein N-acyltransferase [Acidimicrobiaceae bacterium]